MRPKLTILSCVGIVALIAGCGGSSSTDSGTRAATDAACQGASCETDGPVPVPLACGGPSRAQCPQGYRCVADPSAQCSPADDVACSGTCVLGEELPACDADGSCPDGYVCASNVDANGTCGGDAAGCKATCQPKAEGECTSDAECPQLRVACSVCADGTVSCPVSWCDGGYCRVDFKPCAEPPPPAGCAAIRCPAGAHCVEDAACKPDPADPDAAGVTCAAACVPDEQPVQCGGITGQSCPPGQECVDDPNDMCDPADGADCPGMCQVPNGGECKTDADCPQLRAPCSVCADGTVACPRSFCNNGTCNVDFPTCGTPVSCGSDGCKPGTSCADDPNDTCDPATGGRDCPGICVPDNQPRPCSDDAGCPPGYVCATDPSTGCAPDAAGVCAAVCVPVPPPPPQCSSDADCASILRGCMPCPDGSTACPSAVCKAGVCVGVIDACVGPGFCGGIAGFACPPGSTCIDDPTDSCDPQQGGADCGGICVRDDEPPKCGGFSGSLCPTGYDCLDDPRDDCDPNTGGADCPGICRPAPSPQCKSDADCPVIGAPCRMCPDGTAACPRSFCADGMCRADFPTCGTAVSCGSEGCKPGYTCADDPNDTCDPAAGAANCPGICVPDDATRACTDDSMCPPGYLCAMNPSLDCAPDASGVCAGTCVPAPPPPPPTPGQCAVDADCASIADECTPCPDGAYTCPTAVCKDGICVGLRGTCATPGFCGGIAGLPCPPGWTCVDQPNDFCDPRRGGADCGGICVRDNEPQRCGGLAGGTCPTGYECFDDPRDGCDPTNGAADCSGICRPAPSPKCNTDADCPVIEIACRACPDGTAACPQAFCVNGLCTSEFKGCAAES